VEETPWPRGIRKLSYIERITQAGYQVKVQWEWEFDLPEYVKLEEQLPLRTRDALYGWRTEAMRLHYRVKGGRRTICRLMSLYPWMLKYFKFPGSHATIHLYCGDIPTMAVKQGLV
jgi:hypothetical protein